MTSPSSGPASPGIRCPVCASSFEELAGLSSHLVDRAERSDGRHVMWLNRNVTRHRIPAEELEPLLAAVLAGGQPPGDRVNR